MLHRRGDMLDGERIPWSDSRFLRYYACYGTTGDYDYRAICDLISSAVPLIEDPLRAFVDGCLIKKTLPFAPSVYYYVHRNP